ncbi:MAG: family 43 glycosylhydrolase [Lachnospiraceae bacterium]|nr:family 43 glycosylhydrolase [Lachnospiraceae bacterium]
MYRLLSYTIDNGVYYDKRGAYPDNTALNCDVDHSLHLALSKDNGPFVPLFNNTGVWFPEADLDSGVIAGQTKTMLHPRLFRTEDNGFLLMAIRRDQNAPDEKTHGMVMQVFSPDLIHFEKETFLGMPDVMLQAVCTDPAISVPEIPHAVPGSIIDITDAEALRLLTAYGPLYNTGIRVPELTVKAGEKPAYDELPGLTAFYSDSSVHEKKVCWSKEDYDAADFDRPGVYTLRGEVQRVRHSFPFLGERVSDPCVVFIDGMYYLTRLVRRGSVMIVISKSPSLEGLKDAEAVPIIGANGEYGDRQGTFWAPELHIVGGKPYIFTTNGTTSWNTTQSVVYACSGALTDPAAWSGPHYVVTKDGSRIRPDGVSLDMTVLSLHGNTYVLWSDRRWADPGVMLEPDVQDTADIRIAMVDPEHPWQLISDPVVICRPIYGFDRYETKVDEGPFVLKHGDDIFVSISGSSTGLADLYCVFFLHMKEDADPLDPASWDRDIRPALTKESVPGEYGPGHNCFVKDTVTGDDIFVYHAVPHDPDPAMQRAFLDRLRKINPDAFNGVAEESLLPRRYMGVRRVHWKTDGTPYLALTDEQDLQPVFEPPVLSIRVEE